MAAVEETVEQVRRLDVDQYKYGFETKIESEKAPKGLDERHRPLHLGEEERAGLDAGVAARRLSALARRCANPSGRASTIRRSTIRISITTRRRRRGRSSPPSMRSIRRSSRPTRSSAFRCASRRFWPASCAPTARQRGWRSMPCSTRSRSQPPSRKSWLRRA